MQIILKYINEDKAGLNAFIMYLLIRLIITFWSFFAPTFFLIFNFLLSFPRINFIYFIFPIFLSLLFIMFLWKNNKKRTSKYYLLFIAIFLIAGMSFLWGYIIPALITLFDYKRSRGLSQRTKNK